MVRRRRKAGGECQLIVRVERWSVTSSATLSLEHLPARGGTRITEVWIWRRLERVDVLHQREEQLIRKAIYDPATLLSKHVVRAELGRIATRDEHSISHRVLRSPKQMCGRVIDVLAVLQPDQVGCFGWIKRAALKPRKNSPPEPDEVAGADIVFGAAIGKSHSIFGYPRRGPPTPGNHFKCLPRREELQEAGRVVRNKLSYDSDRAARIVSWSRRAVQNAAVGHHPAMAGSTVLLAESQSARSGNPTQSEHRPILLGMSSQFLVFVCGTLDFDQFGVIIANVW